MDTRECPHCGRHHKKTAKFCPATGGTLALPTPLERECPHCRKTVVLGSATARFCPKCGGNILEPPPDGVCPYKDCAAGLMKPFVFCRACWRKLRVCPACGKPFTLAALSCVGCSQSLPPLPGAWKAFKGGAQRAGCTSETLSFPLARRWSFPDEGQRSPALVSPLTYGGLVYFPTAGGVLYALNQYNGKLRWSKPLDSPLISSPVIEDDCIYQATSSGKVYCLERKRGHVRWVFPPGKKGIGAVHAALLLSGDALVVATTKGKIFCLDSRTGKSRWLYPANAGESLGGVSASPAASGGNLVVPVSEGFLICLDCERGDLLWRFPHEERLSSRLVATPAISHDLVYAAERAGRFYAVSLSDGRDAWNLPTQLQGIVEGSPAVAQERVFVGTWESALFSLDGFAGGIQWKFRNENLPAMDCINSTPLVTESGYVLYGGDSGYLYVLTVQGEEVWKHRFDEPLAGSPVISDGFLYVLTRGGALHALA